MKKGLFFALGLFTCMAVNAQDKLPAWLNNVKLSGYGMTQYQYNSQKEAPSNTFNIRFFRATLDGRIKNDFYWKMQLQFNGNTATLGNSPRMVDLFVEWQKYDFFRVKVGQFKVPFTFENPMAPIEQGFMSYSQIVLKLSGFNDRTGEHASNGRDIGLQFQGSFLKNDNGRDLLAYQIGVFNGQGINMGDVDQRKDIAGGLWVMPVKGMRLGAFGWTGTYARKGTWTVVDDQFNPIMTTDQQGNPVKKTQSGIRSLQQDRYALSAEYLINDWTFRTEYIHSTGYGFKQVYQTSADASNAEVNYADGNKADGAYALVIAPILKHKLYAKARYDMYRPSAEWNKSKTYYEAGLTYMLTPNLQLQTEYALVNDRSLGADKQNYSIIDAQVDFKF